VSFGCGCGVLQGLGGAYDLILTSETIYNLDSLQRMVECMKQVLRVLRAGQGRYHTDCVGSSVSTQMGSYSMQ
jgi:hypothetical protein